MLLVLDTQLTNLHFGPTICMQAKHSVKRGGPADLNIYTGLCDPLLLGYINSTSAHSSSAWLHCEFCMVAMFYQDLCLSVRGRAVPRHILMCSPGLARCTLSDDRSMGHHQHGSVNKVHDLHVGSCPLSCANVYRWAFTPDQFRDGIPSAVDGVVINYNTMPGSSNRYFNMVRAEHRCLDVHTLLVALCFAEAVRCLGGPAEITGC